MFTYDEPELDLAGTRGTLTVIRTPEDIDSMIVDGRELPPN
ncbi:hypothetical protein ACFVYA_36205 [Amycolatopsis sp. NPDC058278]